MIFLSLAAMALFGAAWSCGPPTKTGDTCCFESIEVGQGQSGRYGEAVSCGIDDQATLHCWGSYDEDQIRDWASEPIDRVAFTLVAISHDMCVLTQTGHIDCRRGAWFQFEGEATELGGDCALDTEGKVMCHDTSRIDDEALPEGEMVALDNLCAIDVDGHLQCWGDHEDVPDGEFEHLSTRRSSGCAIDADGQLQCWGGIDAPAGRYDDVSVSAGYACAVEHSSGRLDCWGGGEMEFGQNQPPEGSFKQVSTGQNHGCAIDREGYVHCWGKNASGELQAP